MRNFICLSTKEKGKVRISFILLLLHTFCWWRELHASFVELSTHVITYSLVGNFVMPFDYDNLDYICITCGHLRPNWFLYVFIYPSLFSNFASCNQVALAKDYYFIETYYFLIVDIEICMYVQGMGEPLQNIENVIKAADIMVHDQGLHFSPRKVTISTSGLVPQLKRFLQKCNCALAVSLNATTDEVHLHSAPSLFTGESTCMLLTFA